MENPSQVVENASLAILSDVDLALTRDFQPSSLEISLKWWKKDKLLSNPIKLRLNRAK